MSRIYLGEQNGKNLADWINRNAPGVYGTLVIAWRGLLLTPGTAAFWKRGHLRVRGKLVKTPMRVLLKDYLRKESEAMLLAASRAGFNYRAKTWDLTYSEPKACAAPLHSAFALAKEGVLDRVTPCRRCQQWFFARFRHQEFCSHKCQQAHYRSSSEWKEHRASWMRGYRRTISTANVKTRARKPSARPSRRETS